MKKVLKLAAFALLALVLIVAVTAAWVLSWPDFGGEVTGERLARARRTSHFTDGAFTIDPPRPPSDLWVNFKEWSGDQVRRPPKPLPVLEPALSDPPAEGLRATWFGHATVLVELDGRRVLTDPILSDHAFPVHAFAPRRNQPPPLSMERLPPIDVVTISHDHFDHLDMATVQSLSKRGSHFFVGLGIGAHLDRWSVPAAQVHELDWWESSEHAGLTVHCTPARHYSGRTSMGSPTLFSSWVVQGPKHRVFHSGDSGYGPHFADIGRARGPIDLSLVKIGDYGNDPAWSSIHMFPEDSIRAYVDVGAKTLLPIHWGTFDLSFHAWDEPIRRAVKAASDAGVTMVTPRIGEVVAVGEPFTNVAWWDAVAR